MTTEQTQTYDKFLPEGIPSWHMQFWDSLKRHAVQVQRCDECGRYRYVPKDICPNCHSERATWTPISGRGVIYTYTVVRRAPTPAYQADAPYVLAHATMEEGFRMIGKVRTESVDSIHIGTPVQIVYDDVTPEWTLFYFQDVQ